MALSKLNSVIASSISSIRGKAKTSISYINGILVENNPFTAGNYYSILSDTDYAYDGWYTAYTGGFTSVDDGYSSVTISLPGTWYINTTGYTDFYVCTNGYISFGAGYGDIIYSPDDFPDIIAGNPGDMYLDPGTLMTNGTSHNVLTSYSGNSTSWEMRIAVFQGFYSDPTLPASYTILLRVDSSYQYIEIANGGTYGGDLTGGTIGPTGSPQTAVDSQSQVWRTDLDGTNLTFLGAGKLTTVFV